MVSLNGLIMISVPSDINAIVNYIKTRQKPFVTIMIILICVNTIFRNTFSFFEPKKKGKSSKNLRFFLYRPK